MPRYRLVPRDAIKVQLPDTRQETPYSCGASCLQAVCGYFGVGKAEEYEYISLMRIRSSVGAHPHNLLRGVKKFGLHYQEHWPMSYDLLKSYLDRSIPVMMMIQAWIDPAKRRRHWRGWRSEWKEGHWVAAIGYDTAGVFFEDPSLAAIRGFLSYHDLDERWHDVGPYWHPPYEKQMYRYGMAIWRPGTRRPPYYSRAAHID